MAMSLPEKMALSGDSNSKKAKGEAALKLIGKPAVSSGLSIGGKGKAVASSGSRGKAVVSENVDEVMSFRNVRFGPQESEVRFRLIHYWEARKVLSKVLLGLEMLLIDSEVAWFECTATIDDVVHGSGWYYIGCGVFHTKAIKGPTTLMCTKCGESEIVGVAQYLSKISVYDKNDQAVFVLLGDAGQELTGKKASELVESYYEANESVGADHIVPVPQALIDTVGQTRKFIVKVSKHNFTGKIQTFTLTKVLPLEDQEADGNIEENVQLGPVNDKEDPTDESLKRSSEGIATGETKRAKSG
ncbi:unnamed protein product [Eruca vesicaria subsp. sativa]|uniref:Replication factor A C-terminal domain-containing protein n=1 Tax=Eruca vesicaria subsp. sativa TaxID=29727 RepID=A0ABC8LDB8_ERUVS|nr:unnamed protein product [Eruca vesicaria subsp. sativa]